MKGFMKGMTAGLMAGAAIGIFLAPKKVKHHSVKSNTGRALKTIGGLMENFADNMRD